MNIDQYKPWIDTSLGDELRDYIVSGGYITEFRKTKQFETIISEYTSSKYCNVVTSGTTALYIALSVLGIKSGDEVIVPNYTMAATPFSVSSVGATPIFVDIDYPSLCINLERLFEAITKNTKAVIFVAANGRFPDEAVNAIGQLRSMGIPVIEDAAQGLGSYTNNKKHVGTIGDIGCISFSMPKIITTGQGGAIITNNKDLHSKVSAFKNFGRADSGNDIHFSIGGNFKFTDLQAIVGINQFKNLEDRINRKKSNFIKLFNETKNEHLSILPNNTESTTPWFYEVVTQHTDELRNYLSDNGIKTRPMYPPLNKQACYKDHHQASRCYYNSEFIGKNGTWLPSFPQMTNQELKHLIDTLNLFDPNSIKRK